MNSDANAENRALDASEREMVGATRSPNLEQQTSDQLKSLVHRLRQAHSRANDIAARQQREIRGKADPRRASPVKDNAGSLSKVQALFDAIRRVDDELSRREKIETGAPSAADLARHALELKMKSQTNQHPDPGRSASDGMRAKKRIEEFAVGTTRKEIGRVSQANKVSQARKDSGKT
jgi:hypothetical protein